MGLEKQGGKPTGFVGTIIGRLMNLGHTSLYIKYFSRNQPPENSIILDIGCGGGKLLNYLSTLNKSYLLYGLDHSEEMIELSAHINKKIIDQKRLKLIHGSVTEIPIESNYLDLVTAFETVQFWPNIIIAFSEISRILKKGGSFLIINRYPKEDTKWWRMAKLKSSEDYKAQFKNAGFSDISIDLNYKKGWIILRGTKS